MNQKAIYLTAVLLAFIVCCFQTHGQRNAADLYYESETQLADLTTDDDNRIMDVMLNLADPVPADVLRLIRSHSKARSLLIRAAFTKYCDFGLDQIITPETYRPHLRAVHRGYKFLLLDAKMRLQQGDFNGANKSIRAVYAMAEHLRQDHYSMSSHNAMWMIINADRLLAYAQDIGEMNPSRAGRMLRTMQALDQRDPAGIADAVAASFDSALLYYDDLYTRGESQEIDTYLKFFDPDNDSNLNEVEPEQFSDALDSTAMVYDSITEILSSVDDKASRKENIQSVIDSVEKDCLVAKLLPGLKNSLNWSWTLDKAHTLIEDRIAVLEQIAKGEQGVKDFANAAFWYRRGAAKLRQIPAQDWDELLNAMEHSAPAPGPAPASGELTTKRKEQIKLVQEALEVFAEGAAIDRCDFTPIRAGEFGASHTLHIAPLYVVGVREGIELIYARVQRALAEGKIEAAVNDLASCIRIIHHLGGDSVITSSLTAHEAFTVTFDKCAVVMADANWSERYLPTLINAFKAISPADPFGYNHSLRQTRHDLARQLIAVTGKNRENIGELVSGWPDDQMLYGVLVFEVIATMPGDGKAEQDQSSKNPGEDDLRTTRFLHTVYDQEALKKARDDSSTAAALILNGDFQAASTWQGLVVVELHKKKRQSRKDIRVMRKILALTAASE